MDTNDKAGTDLGRRDVLKLGAAATIAASLGMGESLAAQAGGAGQTFFTPAELALVDELSEMILPADDHSPGARAAKVASYLDGRLAEAFDAQERADWREGLRAVDAASQQAAGKAFLEASPTERLAVVTLIAVNEAKPETPAEKFFVTLKSSVVQAYYTSEIGIKQEIGYLGNTYQTDYAGEM